MHNASDPVQELVYSVSHDFGRPIRQIVALTDLLYEQIGDQSDNEAAELFSYLKRAGQEAQEMLARLLIYSRMAGQAPQIEAQADAEDAESNSESDEENVD